VCDYSLEHSISREAEIGDVLKTTSFSHSSTRGFCDAKAPDMPVCMLPGTELAFEAPVKYYGLRGLFANFFSKGAKTARFRQINLEVRATHHDALELDNGKVILVTELKEGQRCRVLQLPIMAAVKHYDAHSANTAQSVVTPAT
jgi:hypothetical protein